MIDTQYWHTLTEKQQRDLNAIRETIGAALTKVLEDGHHQFEITHPELRLRWTIQIDAIHTKDAGTIEEED